MSKFSGKCDLFDFMSGLGGWYDKDGNPVKFGQEGVGCYYSDELKDFEAFKQRTGGVIHQHYLIKTITESNQEFVKEHCKYFDFIKHTRQIPDKRLKTGFKEEVYYTYTYYNKEYTAKEINKKGVYILTDIYFDTILDLIKYYPYIVSVSANDGEKSFIIISDESFIDEEYRSFLNHGYSGNSRMFYDKQLAEHYLEVIQNYYLNDINERSVIQEINLGSAQILDDYYYINTSVAIDYLHNISYFWPTGERRSYWTSPKYIDEHTIALSKNDVENFLAEDLKNNNVFLKYVVLPAGGRKINLN